jgi:hypothetical protein
MTPGHRNVVNVDQLKASVSIATVIGETLHLRRDGRHHVAPCPFHEERTPSFYVYAMTATTASAVERMATWSIG